MRMLTTSILIFALGFVGCAAAPETPPASSAPSRSDIFQRGLRVGRASLEQGRIRSAERHAADALSAASGEGERSMAKALYAEIAIAEKSFGEAVKWGEKAYAISPSPRRLELLGRAYLGKGEFKRAQQLFLQAFQEYACDEDRRRAEDLATISAGLILYSESEIRASREAWSEIRDPEKRNALNLAIRRVAGSDLLQPQER